MTVRDEGVGVIRVHVVDDGAGVRRDGVGPCAPPIGELDPGHPAVAADVANGLDVQAPEGEVRVIDVVLGVRVRAQVGLLGRAALRFSASDLPAVSDQGHATSRQRVAVPGFGHQKGCTGVTAEIFRVLGELADEKDGAGAVHRERDEGAVGEARRLFAIVQSVPVGIAATRVAARSPWVGVGTLGS